HPPRPRRQEHRRRFPYQRQKHGGRVQGRPRWLAKSATPDQVRNLTEGVRAELAPDERGRFDQLTGGTDKGERPQLKTNLKLDEGPEKLPEPHTGIDDGKGPAKVSFDPHRVRQSQVDNDTAAGTLNGLSKGKGKLPPAAKAPDGKVDVNISGYRLDPDAAEFTKQALKATPQNARELKRSIVKYETLDQVQKGELVRLVQDRLQGEGFDNMTPEQRRARTKELLSQMDRRNVKARREVELIALGIAPQQEP
ncbi:MAG: hypothetical protein JKY68_03545, partial [Rhodospirillales bacterium]|nr:hypothetical protein [Rhodospirillales bacterium]